MGRIATTPWAVVRNKGGNICEVLGKTCYAVHSQLRFSHSSFPDPPPKAEGRVQGWNGPGLCAAGTLVRLAVPSTLLHIPGCHLNQFLKKLSFNWRFRFYFKGKSWGGRRGTVQAVVSPWNLSVKQSQTLLIEHTVMEK